MVRKTLLILTVFIIVWGCERNENSLNNKIEKFKDTYFPIQLGNSWNFDLEYYDYYYNQKHKEVTYTITSKKIINGENFYAFDEWPYFIHFPLVYWFDMDSVFIRNDKNGDVVLKVHSNEFLFIKFDPALCDSMIKTLNLFESDYWVTHIEQTGLVYEKLSNGYHIAFFTGPGSQTYVDFYPDFGMVEMYYPAYSLTFKLKSAVINSRKLTGIIQK